MNEFGSRKTKAVIAVILARVSSKEQEEGYSIDAQKNRCQTYCARNNLNIVKIFEIVESSTQGERKEFMDMIAFLKKGKEPIALVADKVDRIQRSFKEYPLLDSMIQANKIELHFNSENYIIHKDSISQERTMWSMGVIMAQSYVDNLRDNVKRSIDHKIKLGEWIAMAPLGYLNIQDERNRGDIIIDEERAPIIRKMFEEYGKGISSLKEIREMTVLLGLRNRSKAAASITISQVHNILKNPFYYGKMIVKGKAYEHRYTPLISKAQFDLCQSVMKGWNKKPFKYGNKEFLFRGLLTCATTGKMVTADKKSKTYASGKKATWTYLRCWSPDDPQKIKWVREDVIIEQANRVLEKFRFDDDFLDDLNKHIRDSDKTEREYFQRQLQELNRRNVLVQSRLDALMDIFLDGAITKDEYDQKKSRLKDEQRDIECGIAEHSVSDGNFKDILISLITFVSTVHDYYHGSTIIEKRKLLNTVFANLELKGETLCYSLRKPFDVMLNCTVLEEWRPLLDDLRMNHTLRSTVINLYQHYLDTT